MALYNITDVTEPYKYGDSVKYREIKFKKETRQAIVQKHLMDGKIIEFPAKNTISTNSESFDSSLIVSGKYSDRINRLNVKVRSVSSLTDGKAIQSSGRRPIKVKKILSDNMNELVNSAILKDLPVENTLVNDDASTINSAEPVLDVDSIDAKPITVEPTTEVQQVVNEMPTIDITNQQVNSNPNETINIQPERNAKIYGMDSSANLFPKKDIIPETVGDTDYKSSLINSTYKNEIEQLRKDNDNMNDVILQETVTLKQLEDKYSEMLERTTKIEIETLRRELIRKREEAAKIARRKQQVEEMLKGISNENSFDKKVA